MPLPLMRFKEVGSGSHFFSAEHTKRRFKDAFYAPFLSDWRNFETWEEAGSLRVEQRAHLLMKSILEEYTPPPIDKAIEEELSEFVKKRKAEGGAPTDFLRGKYMAEKMKNQAKVVVIGGGVVGASVLYHLSKLGWSDVMLLERFGADFGLNLACGGGHAHAQWRPECSENSSNIRSICIRR